MCLTPAWDGLHLSGPPGGEGMVHLLMPQGVSGWGWRALSCVPGGCLLVWAVSELSGGLFYECRSLGLLSTTAGWKELVGTEFGPHRSTLMALRVVNVGGSDLGG